MKQKIRNLLVHSLVNIGDVVLSTSAVALLKKHYPGIKVTMMVKPAAAELLKNNPIIDDVIIFEYQAKEKSWSAMWRFLREIRKSKFDASISLDRKLRPALLTWLAGIPIRIGPDRIFDNKKNRVTNLYTHVVHTPDDFMNTHQSELFQSIIKSFFQIDDKATPVIGRIKDSHMHKVEQLLNKLPSGKKRIALCVKGTYYLKNWPQEKFVSLIEKMAENLEAAFFIVGAPEDREYAESIVRKVLVPVENFCGQTSLMEFAALMDKSDLLITIDTGGMHIAATTKVPIVGIFRCVSQKRWQPLTSRGTTITIKQDDCPLVKNPEDCPMKYCVKDISVEDVYQKVIKMLK